MMLRPGRLPAVLGRYLLASMLGPLLGVLALLCGVVLALQGLRLGHHLLGPGVGAGLLGLFVLYSLPTLLGFCLPYALFAGALLGLGRLGVTGQLEAMRLLGIAPTRLARPAAALGLACALVAVASGLLLEPWSLGRLHGTLARNAARVLVLGARPGRFLELVPGTTAHAGRRLPAPAGEARFADFFLARREPAPGLVLTAARARMVLAPGERLVLELQRGELQQRTRHGLRRVRFETLRLVIALGPSVERHLGFLTRLADPRARALQGAATCLALALLAALLGLSRLSPPVQAGAALVGAALVHAALLGAGLLLPEPWGPPAAAALVTLAAALGLRRLG